MIPALIIIIIAAFTDLLDGQLARKYNCVTDFGKKLDAVCDKIFSTSLLIPLSIEIPYFLMSILLEVFISLININSEAKGNKPVSNKIGKIKTFFLSAFIIIAYIEIFTSYCQKALYILFSITVIMQIWALFKYYFDDKKKL